MAAQNSSDSEPKNAGAGNNNNNPQQAPSPPYQPGDRNAMAAQRQANLRLIQLPPGHHFPPGVPFPPIRAQLPYQQQAAYEDEEIDDESGIFLTVNADIIMNGDKNIMTYDPAAMTSKVTLAVVAAFKQMSMGAMGIPMIDENGAPRPIKVTVHANTKIEGSKNVIGETEILEKMGYFIKEEADGEPKIKRERVEDDVSAFAEFKKARRA